MFVCRGLGVSLWGDCVVSFLTMVFLFVFLCGYMRWVGAPGALDLLEVESSIHLLWEGGPELCKPTVLYLGPQQRARDNTIVVLFTRHYGRESGV